MTDYTRPSRLKDALAQLADGGRVVLAGGTDLYPGAGSSLQAPVLDVTDVDEMQGITLADGLRIGGAVTWAQIAAASLPPALGGLQQAAVQIGGRQVQNVGTLAGNICNASPAADGVPPLLTLDAMVELASPRGRRELPLAAFIQGPRRTARAPDELVVAVRLSPKALAGRGVFHKLGARAHLVISIVSVAVKCVTTGGIVSDIAIAAGACSAVPCRLPQIEAAVLGARSNQVATRVRFGDVAACLSPIADIRATADYRLHAVTELIRRAVQEAAA